MEQRFKQRLVGAVVLVSLAVVFVPILFDMPPDMDREASAPSISQIPERPRDHAGAPVNVTLDPPQTLRLDAEVERERSMSEADADGGASPAAVEAATATTVSPAAPQPSAPPAPATRTDPSPAPSDTASAAGTPAGGSERKRAAPAPAAGDWTVQLGSFAKPENARALHKRLQDKGYSAFVESASSAQGAVSRVLVGPMSDRKQAEESVVKLRREMALDGIVVPYSGG